MMIRKPVFGNGMLLAFGLCGRKEFNLNHFRRRWLPSVTIHLRHVHVGLNEPSGTPEHMRVIRMNQHPKEKILILLILIRVYVRLKKDFSLAIGEAPPAEPLTRLFVLG